jgi:hypothetical protein
MNIHLHCWLVMLWKGAPILTSFAVLFVGTYLARRAHKRQWLGKNQKREYSELLNVMTKIELAAVKQSGTQMSRDEIQSASEELIVIVNTRLFISEFLAKNKLVHDLIHAIADLEARGHLAEFQREYGCLANLVIEAAKAIDI